MSLADKAAFPRAMFDLKYAGMSYREWVAGRALSGLLADPDAPMIPQECAEVAVRFADALIAALEKPCA